VATEPSPQRAYSAACPNCGAAVAFRSAASASAVCSYCRSTLVRDGQALKRIGVSSELFDDHSPLQLGASGRWQGVAFTLVGRLQYGYADGTWNEWHALLDTGADEAAPRSAWLSEDNGAYVMAFDRPRPADAPAPAALKPGARMALDGGAWNVASVVRAKLIAAEGELPRPPALAREFTVVDLRNPAGEVGTLDDADPAAPAWAIGRSVALPELALQGLREVAEKTLAARSVPCPSCGAALEPTLASTRSISCKQCHAVVDLAGPDGQGIGAELAHYAQQNSGSSGRGGIGQQAEGIGPQIALGRSGRFAFGGGPELPWQVVGYLERCDIPEDGSDDEQTFWREYLLYNQTGGFAFLVDADDGWSWVRPITGAPEGSGGSVRWQGAAYRLKYTYPALVTWVQGEFYWRVRRDERAIVSDYHGPGGQRLSREQTGSEVTWSAGSTINAALVADAFGLTPAERPAIQRDAAPMAMAHVGSGLPSIAKIAIVFIVLAVMIAMLSRCDSGSDCDKLRQTFGAASNEYQQCLASRNRGGGIYGTGGSFGGYSSSGGGHK
jgi:endogenous inhibitor of DNA gyrase (YacG/DUF329 family)